MAKVDLKELEKNFKNYLEITETIILLKIAYYKKFFKKEAKKEVYKEFLRTKEENWKKKTF